MNRRRCFIFAGWLMCVTGIYLISGLPRTLAFMGITVIVGVFVDWVVQYLTDTIQ